MYTGREIWEERMEEEEGVCVRDDEEHERKVEIIFMESERERGKRREREFNMGRGGYPIFIA